MSMEQGVDVVIADDESVVQGSGLQLQLYNAELAKTPPENLPTPIVLGQTTDPFDADNPATQLHVDLTNPAYRKARLKVLRDIAMRANVYGGTIVAFLKANATAVITTTTSCGRTPDPNTAGQEIQGPAAEVELSIR